MSSYFNQEGAPISADEWRRDFEAVSKRQLARTDVGNGFVSTVWLGLDHSFGHGPPMIFESMAFVPGVDELQERYATRAEALAGHEKMVAEVKAELEAKR